MKRELLNILIYIFFPAIFTNLFTNNINSKKYNILMLISYILLTIYFIIKYKKTLIKYIKDFKINHIKTTLLYLIIGLTLTILSNYLINTFILPNQISNNELNTRQLLLNYPLIYSIILCILVPILEEIVFRLELKDNKHFIIYSSTIFALLHIVSSSKLIEIIYFIPYFILGITFSTIYKKTNNITSNIIAHILNNTITAVIVLVF